MSEKSKPIPIPPPNNERTSSWFGWGNSFYTPNKTNVENIVPMDDNEKISSSDTDSSEIQDTNSDTGYDSEYDPDTLLHDDKANTLSQSYVYNKAFEFVKSKNKCQQFRDFMVNAPDVIVMWSMMATACLFRAPEAFFISLFWYATEKDKHQKEQLKELNDKEKLNKQD